MVAGIAGLGAAISIHNDLYRVTIIESAKELAEVGAGVQIVREKLSSFAGVY